MIRVPPAFLTFAAVSSTLSTQMYVFQVAADGASWGIGPMPATSLPRIRPMK
jgi:hypothetical protein